MTLPVAQAGTGKMAAACATKNPSFCGCAAAGTGDTGYVIKLFKKVTKDFKEELHP